MIDKIKTLDYIESQIQAIIEYYEGCYDCYNHLKEPKVVNTQLGCIGAKTKSILTFIKLIKEGIE